MGYLDDSDSENDSSLSSNGEFALPEAKRDSDYSAANVLEGDLEKRMKSLMDLKNEMGVEQDPDYVEKEARKQAKKDEIAEQKRKEQEAVKGMSDEDRIQHERQSAGNMMDLIRQKREQSQKDSLGTSSHQIRRKMPGSRKLPARSKSMGNPKSRRLVPTRTASNDSLGAMSAHSACSAYTVDTTGMEEDELTEFQKLKARKERRKMKSKRIAARAS